MTTETVHGVRVIFDPAESETGGWVVDACARALPLIQELWGLQPPADCRVYVMTSWLTFFFQSAPWSWRVMLAATVPFWAPRARRTWPYSAGWTQYYGRRVAIGVKPPWLLEQSDKSVGVHMFVEEPVTRTKIEHLVCHELTHACAAHLRLPPWLNEGLATVTVDRFLGKQTIRQDTLELLRDFQPKAAPPSYREMSRMGGSTLAYHAVRGYWLVCYLEDRFPGLVRRVLALNPTAREREIALELGLKPQSFWREIDNVLLSRKS